MLILGSLGIFAKSALDIETLSRYSESFVGFMLLGIGLWAGHKTFVLSRSGTLRIPHQRWSVLTGWSCERR